MTDGHHDGGATGARSAGGGRAGGPGAHLKRYGVFYAIAAVIAVVAVVVPMLGDDDGGDVATGGADTGAVDAGDAGANGDDDVDGAWSPGSGDLRHGTGEATRNGEACDEGVLQVPDSVLAVPCLPEFTGDNGGATFRGVTDDEIVLVNRVFPGTANSDALDAKLRESGFATAAEAREIGEAFVEHFNDTYELYGRRVRIVEWESRFSNGTTELLGQGREGACQDATAIVEELGAFGVVGGSSAVFAECAAERELVTFSAAAYYPESFYEDQHPYAWNSTMSCTVINEHVANYIGRRLAGKPAARAGDPAMHDRTRVFGSYSPENEQYVECGDLQRQILRDEYDVDTSEFTIVRYALDISRFQSQAAQAVLQFKADGVTTVVLQADAFSVAFLTNAAEEQDYRPEWIVTGSAGMDTDNQGRANNQDQTDGHMWGISQISDTEELYGTDSEPHVLYRELHGEEMRGGTTGNFYAAIHYFNLLQAAGPDLTPENMAAGVRDLPPLGGGGRVTWYFGDSHTATKDAREVYWDGQAEPGSDQPDPDVQGRFVATYDGRRFMPDEWPAEDPPIYPDR
jgi:hypothetical protein